MDKIEEKDKFKCFWDQNTGRQNDNTNDESNAYGMLKKGQLALQQKEIKGRGDYCAHKNSYVRIVYTQRNILCPTQKEVYHNHWEILPNNLNNDSINTSSYMQTCTLTKQKTVSPRTCTVRTKHIHDGNKTIASFWVSYRPETPYQHINDGTV